jgi:protocatechuate 3,4-dioxygenase beta subunit
LLGSLGVLGTLAACSGSDNRSSSGSTSTSSASSTSTTGAADVTTCTAVPEETQGPYVLDLGDDERMIRSDITEGRPGVALELTMTLVDVARGCAPLAGARVDLWHCDKDGVYSGFDQPGLDTEGETFMRGIQVSDANGVVRFTTIYPGWYEGRVTHIHFQVFVDGEVVSTSQLAFPDDVTAAVYESSLYAGHGQNTGVPTTAADMVFADGADAQLLTMTGNVDDGYDATITVGI